MQKAELKAVLKPLIKECIKEVMFEDGVLSGIISEVAHGLTAATPLVERKAPQKKAAPPQKRQAPVNDANSLARQEVINSINKDAYGGVNIFEGTSPMSSAGNPAGGPVQPQSPLSGTDPSDPGVNIDGIINIAGDAWGKFI